MPRINRDETARDASIKFAAIAATLLLASCGGKAETKQENSTGVAGNPVVSPVWDAADACKLLDKSVLGTALKDPVTETSLGLVNQASGANAATSECRYTLASGANATLMTRCSPIADNTDEAIAASRKQMQSLVGALGKTVEDVPNLGKAAFFVPGINQMNVYIDDEKFVILTISSAPNETARATAINLVKKIGN